jgi:DNA-binding FadR family transcriptional regulator
MDRESSSSVTAADLRSASTGSLSARVAGVLMRKIQEGGFVLGTKLPTENALAQRFGVSRTVIREAIASLKAEGVVETRQGSGAFVCRPRGDTTFHIDPLTRESVFKLLQLIEVRRGLEAEIAALAAVRRDDRQLAGIRQTLVAIDQAVAAGGTGVDQDVRFHLAIADATGNPYWTTLVEMFAQQLRAAMAVTRANEARRADFVQAVGLEHERIVAAIAAGDAVAARAAATGHMERAAERLAAADQEFWNGEGRPLIRNPGIEPGGPAKGDGLL